MATFPVKWYASNMQGAPSLGDTADGALAALLKAVLVTGFGTLTPTSIVWDAAEDAAKVTIAAGHSYLQDSVVAVSGATPTAYNGEFRVKKVTATELWLPLDGGNPGMAASGTLSIKVAPLGWTLTHESADQKVAIYRPTDISASGNVSLRVDNTAWSGWTNASYNAHLAKVQLVEDVVDINTYTLIHDHRWPATGRYSDKRWDIIGDSQLFYFLPAYAAGNYQFAHCFGYIKSVRPGDRYHAVLSTYSSTSTGDQGRNWGYSSSNYTDWGNNFPQFDNSTHRVIARPYHQLFGTTGWWMKGLFGRIGNGVNLPNGPDNGFYMSTDPIMVMETNNHLRGYLPGLIVPFATMASWDRKNFRDLPALPGKIVRFIRAGYSESNYTAGQVSLMGFDLSGPWR